MKHFINFISSILAELLLIIGAIFILMAAYKTSMIAVYYTIGIMISSIGIFVATTRR